MPSSRPCPFGDPSPSAPAKLPTGRRPFQARQVTADLFGLLLKAAQGNLACIVDIPLDDQGLALRMLLDGAGEPGEDLARQGGLGFDESQVLTNDPALDVRCRGDDHGLLVAQLCGTPRAGPTVEARMDERLIESLRTVADEARWTTERLLDHLHPYDPIAVRDSGGFALLLDARSNGDLVLLKLPRPLNDPLGPRFEDAVENLLHEGDFLRRAGPTPNLVGLAEFRHHQELPFLALEPLGRSLDEVTPEDGVELFVCLRVVRDVATALVHVHGDDLVHNDINPRNILEGPDGWTLIDPSPVSSFTVPFTQERESGWQRDILALGRTFISTYLGYNEVGLPEGLGEIEDDPALKRLVGRMLGERGHDDIPSAVDVHRAARQILDESGVVPE